MKRGFLVVIIVLLAANLAMPAFGSSPYATLKRVLSLDNREAAHYKNLNTRFALGLRLTETPTRTVLASKSMGAVGNGVYQGSVGCSSGTLVSGGVDWGGSPTIYPSWHVIYSAPDSLKAITWDAAVGTGSSPPPALLPQVYAICATGP